MVKEAGQVVYGDGRTVSFPGDGTAAPGDLVALDGDGKATQAGDGDNPVGVLSDEAPDHADGDNVPVHTGDIVVANVATGTSAGEGLDVSATAGEATPAIIETASALATAMARRRPGRRVVVRLMSCSDVLSSPGSRGQPTHVSVFSVHRRCCADD